MPDKNNNAQDSKFKADDFDKEKEEAKKNEKESKTITDDSRKLEEQEILKKQKETD